MTDMRALAKAGVAAASVANETVAVKQDVDQFRKLLEERLPLLAEASLRRYPPEFIVSTVLTCLRHTPKLRECKPATILHGVLQATQVGLRLDPVLGEAWLIPRRNNGVWEANFQPGYKGYLKLMRRNPNVLDVDAHIVRASDKFSFQYGRNRDLQHSFSPTATMAERGEIIGAYACTTLRNGGFQFIYWPADRIEAFGEEYATSDKPDSIWQSDFEAAAKKTMLNQLAKLIPGEDQALASIATLDELDRRGIPQGIDIAEGQLVHSMVYDEQPQPASGGSGKAAQPEVKPALNPEATRPDCAKVDEPAPPLDPNASSASPAAASSEKWMQTCLYAIEGFGKENDKDSREGASEWGREAAKRLEQGKISPKDFEEVKKVYLKWFPPIPKPQPGLFDNQGAPTPTPEPPKQTQEKLQDPRYMTEQDTLREEIATKIKAAEKYSALLTIKARIEVLNLVEGEKAWLMKMWNEKMAELKPKSKGKK